MKIKTMVLLLCSALLSLGHSAEIKETVEATQKQTKHLFDVFHACKLSGDTAPITEVLRTENISVNTKGLNKYSMLHYACQTANPLMTEFLLSIGANVNAIAASNYTPLHILSMHELHEDGLTQLSKDNFDRLSERTVQAATLLLNADANINALAGDGATPLSYAAMRKNPFLVRLLLDRRANPMLGDFITARMMTGNNPFMKERHTEALAIIDAAQKAAKNASESS